MKVWEFDRYGPPSVMTLKERAIPTLGPNEVLLEVRASGINPSDVKNVAGGFQSPLPRVPGRDYAGVVVKGEGRDGEEVWGSGPGFGVARDGADAEYIAVSSDCISAKPRNLSMAQAASLGVPYLAGWSALVVTGDIRPGETILITGVSGAVGNAAVQIAHARGARVIGAGRSMENPSRADSMIDATKQNLADAVLALTGGRGVDFVLDTVGGPLFAASLQSLRPGGRQVAIASHPPVVSFNLVDFYHGLKSLIGFDTLKLTGKEIAGILDGLRDGFESGTLRAPPIQTWPFERAVEAYEAVERRDPPVKHVLVMGTA
jgi:NADPH:quinone reductase-like Zn-dependent oxidoreductase